MLVAEVTEKLHKLKTDSAAEEEVVNEGLIVGQVDQEVQEEVVRMPDVVNFEDEIEVDAADALREGIQAVAKVNWDNNDLKYVFKKLEIAIAASGAKKQYKKIPNCLHHPPKTH